ncbi:MAG: hypothetical protein ACQESO_07515 [Bacillota bacterium]
MKKALMFAVFVFVLVLSVGLVVGCGQPDAGPDEEVNFDFPENNEVSEKVLGIVIILADRLNEADGYYGDLHDVVVANGNRQGPEHDELYEIFNGMLYETGATYVYSLIEGDDDDALIIVDGAEPEDMDPYGYAYPMEPQMETAFAGTPAVALHTWMDDYGYGVQKSAFAPVFNSAGEVAFILGVDYPAPELEPFPEILDE